MLRHLAARLIARAGIVLPPEILAAAASAPPAVGWIAVDAGTPWPGDNLEALDALRHVAPVGLLGTPAAGERLAVLAARLEPAMIALTSGSRIEVDAVQSRLRRRVLVSGAERGDAGAVEDLVRRTGCGVMCDLNACTPSWLRDLPAHAVGALCASGAPVAEREWQSYEDAARRFPNAATLVAWNGTPPSLAVLTAEARIADCRRALALDDIPARARAA